MLFSALAGAILPTVSDGIGKVFNHFWGSPEPKSVDDQIKLMDAKAKQMESLAKLDTVGENVSAWVNNVRAMQRPVACFLITCAWIASFFIENAALLAITSELEGGVVGYLFGERFNLKLKGK